MVAAIQSDSPREGKGRHLPAFALPWLLSALLVSCGNQPQEEATANEDTTDTNPRQGIRSTPFSDTRAELLRIAAPEEGQKVEIESWLASLDDQGFSDLIAALENDRGWKPGFSVATALMQRWVKKDPEEALLYGVAALQAEAEGTSPSTNFLARAGLGESGVVDSFSVWFSDSPDAARAFLTAADAKGGALMETLAPVFTPFVQQVLHASDRDGLPGLSPWVTGLQNETARLEAQRLFAESVARISPADAVDWVMSEVDPSETRVPLERAAAHWGIREPHSALAWAYSLEDAELRQFAIGATVDGWTRQHPDSLATFLEENREAFDLEEVVAVFSLELAERDPDKARQWASEIADQDLREKLVTSIDAQAEAAARNARPPRVYPAE